jgi:hypothetical protein
MQQPLAKSMTRKGDRLNKDDENDIDSIKPDDWFNIPNCLVKALKKIIGHSLELEQKFKEKSSVDEDRENKNQGKFKAIDKLIVNKDDSLRRDIEYKDHDVREFIKDV